MTQHTPTPWQQKGVAIAGYTIALLGKYRPTRDRANESGSSYKSPVVVFHNRFAYRLANGIGIVKIGTLIFISITGFVVLGGHTRIQNPTANFHNAFEGKPTAYGTTNGLYKIIFSYAGFENAFNVANEVKVRIEQNLQNEKNSTIHPLTVCGRTL